MSNESVKSDHPVMGRVENALVTGALYGAVCVSLVFWVLLLPVWVFKILRSVVAFGVLNVISVFQGGRPADPQRLEDVVSMWPRGYRAIIGILSGDVDVAEVERPDLAQLLIETGLAIVFYSVLFFMSELARMYASHLFAVAGWLIGSAFAALAG